MRPLFVVILVGCGKTSDLEFPEPKTVPCEVSQPSPYPNLPYVGIHAGPDNDDVINCDTADDFASAWQVLEGHAIAQPPLLSPDASTVYVTSSNAFTDGCTVYALSVENGSQQWCRTLPKDVIASAVTVDEDGFLYLTAGDQLRILEPNGDDSDVLPFDLGAGAFGVQFLPDGRVVTQNANGVISVFGRDGTSRIDLDVATVMGFVAAPAGADLVGMLPDAVQEDMRSVYGGDTSGIAAFLGTSGNFNDNTVAVDGNGSVYVVGGGPDTNTGALVKVDVGSSRMDPRWYVPLAGGSAASASVSSDGKWVVTSDGTASGDPSVVLVDIEACDNNTDGNDEFDICEPAVRELLTRGPMQGAPGILGDGTVVFWERSFDVDGRDIVFLSPTGEVTERKLPGNLDWSSPVTISNTHIYGTASDVVISDQTVLPQALPGSSTDYLMVLDRDGIVVSQIELTDDATASIAVGPDGSLFVPLLGLINTLATDERPFLGLIRMRPI